MNIKEVYNHECTLCPLALSENLRSVCVPARGDPSSRALIVGEAPGEQEDKENKPFVGSSGRKLEEALAKAFKEVQFYSGSGLFAKSPKPVITNAAKCRPPRNRTPTTQEMDACFEYLAQEVEIVDPVAIMTLGNAALYAVSGQKGGVTKIAGLWRQIQHPSGDPLLVIPNLHPSFVLRFPEHQEFFEEIVKDFVQVWRYGLTHTTEETWRYARP